MRISEFCNYLFLKKEKGEKMAKKKQQTKNGAEAVIEPLKIVQKVVKSPFVKEFSDFISTIETEMGENYMDEANYANIDFVKVCEILATLENGAEGNN